MAGESVIGSLLVTLGLDITNFERGSDRATQSSTTLSNALSQSSDRMSQSLARAAQNGFSMLNRSIDDTRSAIGTMFNSADTDRLVNGLREGGQAGQSAAREIAAALANIDDATERNRQGLQLFGNAWRDVERDAQRSLSSMRDELRRTEDSADDLKGKIAGALAGVAGMGFAGAMDSATTSAGHLRAMLGLTKEEAEEFDRVAKQVYADNFGESMREASEVTARTHQVLGLVGDELKAQTENVFRLNDVFSELGADTQMDLEAVRAITKAWGIDAQTAFDIITTGFQNEAGSSGDLLDTFQEYPAHFQAIGLSAQDMLNWLNIGMENGARNTDLLADAVKEFGIRVKTEGDTAQRAISQLFPADEAQRIINDFALGGEAGRNAFFRVFEALNQVGSEQDKYNLGDQLMGTKFEDLTANQISNLVAGFSETKDKTVDLSGATNSLNEEYSGFYNWLSEIGKSLSTSFLAPLGDAIPIIAGIVDIGSKFGLTLLGLSAAGIDVGSIMSKLWLIIRAVGLFFTSLASVVIPAVISALSLIEWPVVLIAGLIAGLIYLGYELVKNWDELMKLASDVWKGISYAVGVAIDYMKEHWQGFEDFFIGMWEGLWGPVRGFLNLMIEGVNWLIDGLNQIKISVPDWDIMPDSIQGQSWGINIGKIPKLHTGGIFRAPAGTTEGLALLKDGEEVSVPGTSTKQTVNHTGTITVKGTNDKNQLMGAVDIIMDQLRREVRI